MACLLLRVLRDVSNVILSDKSPPIVSCSAEARVECVMLQATVQPSTPVQGRGVTLRRGQLRAPRFGVHVDFDSMERVLRGNSGQNNEAWLRHGAC